MSLADSVIESFNGYEKAKAVLNNPNASLLHNVESLKQRLLEYRRAHNIFEVGDLVVMVDADDYSTIFKVIAKPQQVIGKPQWLYHLQGCDDLFYGRLDFQIRHATDAEIEAGKRLNNEEEH